VAGCDRYSKKSHVTKNVTGYHTFLSAQHKQCPRFLIKGALSFKGLGIQKRTKPRKTTPKRTKTHKHAQKRA